MPILCLPRRSDTGGKPQDELQAMEGVMPGWCDFMRACRTGRYILLPREGGYL